LTDKNAKVLSKISRDVGDIEDRIYPHLWFGIDKI